MTTRTGIDDLTDPDGIVNEVAKNAVKQILDSHASTGTDVTDRWEDILALITLVHPYIVIEGTCTLGVTENTVQSAGETGRYWLDGNTDLPCNADAAYGASTTLEEWNASYRSLR